MKRIATFCGMLALLTSGAFGASLVEAAKNQDTAALRSLLKQKVDVNTPDVDGTTALTWAAHQNDLDAVKLLLAAGANANAANRYQVTALAEACNVGNGEMIGMLLKAG